MTLPFGLGELRVLSPAALWALLALPVVLAAVRRTPAVAVLRAASTAVVVLALAGLSLERPRPEAGTCLVALVDVSASVADAGRQAARDTLAHILPLLGEEDLVGVVAFAGRARVIAHPGPGRRALAALADVDTSELDADETDLAAALATGAPLCPETKQAAVLLFTDGNETEGSLLAEAALTEPRLPIFPVLPPAAWLPPASLRRLLAPAVAAAHAVLPLEAVVESRADAPITAAIEMQVNGQSLLPVPIDIPPGVSAVRLPYSFDDPGGYLLEAKLLFPAGAPARAASVAAPITVTPALQVLLVSERERPVVALALLKRGMDVHLTTPAGFAARTDRLADYHLVILDDVARGAIPDRALEATARWVADGGALIATGGGHLFGDAGFVGTPLERVLPVTLQSQRPEPKQREPIALYLLIDRSNSMGYASSETGFQYGEKMEYAKRAALAVIDQLGPRDLVGATAFDSQPYELGALLPLAQARSALVTNIRQLRYGGGTDFKEALANARSALLAAGPRVRHVILLTDGDTNRRAEDHDELIAALARDEITVTTIRIGSDTANLDLLERISRGTGGAFHHVEDVQALPQLMISDAQHLMNAAANRQEATVRAGEPGQILAGIAEEELPPLARWAVTRPKPGAELRLWVDAGDRHDPLLATWQYELGRVAALPMDFQAGAAAWPTWRGFTKLWSQLAMWAAPPALAAARRLEGMRLGSGTLVRVDTVADASGPFLLRLEGADAVALRPTGRRRFEALVSNLEAGVHPAVLLEEGREESVDLVVAPRGAAGHEYRAGAPNVTLLEKVAALTGGRVAPAPVDVLALGPGVQRLRIPLELALVPVAILLILVELAVRRAMRG